MPQLIVPSLDAFLPCSYHVVPGVAAASTDLADGDVLPTLLGQNITVSIDADGVSLISANPAVPAAKVIQVRKEGVGEGGHGEGKWQPASLLNHHGDGMRRLQEWQFGSLAACR